jgi:heat shock protein HslJ
MEQPTPDAALTGTEWQLTTFVMGNTADSAASSLVGDTAITILFNEDGTVGGSAGCNEYGGMYQAEGETLTITEITQTLKLCEDEAVMAQEMALVEALQTAATYAIEGNQLTINHAGGSLVFTAAE